MYTDKDTAFRSLVVFSVCLLCTLWNIHASLSILQFFVYSSKWIVVYDFFLTSLFYLSSAFALVNVASSKGLTNFYWPLSVFPFFVSAVCFCSLSCIPYIFSFVILLCFLLLFFFYLFFSISISISVIIIMIFLRFLFLSFLLIHTYFQSIRKVDR